MKCLIIAAGEGSRLSQKYSSKPLTPLLGVPLVERVIRLANQAGIDDFCVVTGCKGEMVRPFLDDVACRLQVRIAHAINDEWERGNGVSVLKARECVDDPFFLLMTDHLFDPTIMRELAKHPPDQGQITLAVDSNLTNPLIDLNDVTRVKCEDGKVRDIGKRIPDFNGFDAGIFLCTSALFDALERCEGSHGEVSLSDAVRCLAAEGKVNVFDIGGRFWIDVDDPKALDRAEQALLERLRSKPNDGPVSRHINRPLSVRISRYLVRTPVTPNQISLISFVLSLIAAGLLAAGSYAALIAGGVLAQLASVIDGCDGEVARLKFLRSDFGGWFDAVLDRYADALLLFGLTWHAYAGGGNGLTLGVGFLAIIGSFMLSYTADKYDRLMQARITTGGGLRIGRDVRVFLIFLGALFNRPFLTLLVIAVLMNLEVVRRVWVAWEHG